MLGRGMNRPTKGGPWMPTEALEVCNENSAHLPVRVPADDNNPACLIGGGELNILAGAILWRKHRPKITVCAYGARSSYLRSINGPSESQVMSEGLQKLVPEARICIWEPPRGEDGTSNTDQELRNIMNLAVENGFKEIGIVTVTVHLPRTIFFAKNHLELPEFARLEVRYFASELVLVESNPKMFAKEMVRIYGSQSFLRNAANEAKGIQAILDGKYQPVAG